jgi:hypothetical protein
MALQECYALSIRVETSTGRGMSCGNETATGTWSVAKEPQGASVFFRQDGYGAHRGFGKMRLSREEARALIRQLQEAIE